MIENRENWLYPNASGLYFTHDGFIMRARDGKQYDYEEECELLNGYDKKYNECRNDVLRLEKENEQLKQQLFETSKELLWSTSDEVDRTLHYEDEVEELRKEIFE